MLVKSTPEQLDVVVAVVVVVAIAVVVGNYFHYVFHVKMVHCCLQTLQDSFEIKRARKKTEYRVCQKL